MPSLVVILTLRYVCPLNHSALSPGKLLRKFGNLINVTRRQQRQNTHIYPPWRWQRADVRRLQTSPDHLLGGPPPERACEPNMEQRAPTVTVYLRESHICITHSPPERTSADSSEQTMTMCCVSWELKCYSLYNTFTPRAYKC
ncbi:hypothetical protein J6590_089216 [Homalodisca vitripennis]|nr:hypothetical protein J6590_089216 [Homalodisca vitripennis]